MGDWTFITRHGQVLLSIANGRGKTAREIGDEVGVTERTVHKLISDLENDGYITRFKAGNRNVYEIRPEMPMKVTDVSVGTLLELLGWERRKKRGSSEKGESSINRGAHG